MGEEGLELLARPVSFQASTQPDELLERFADRQMMGEMQKVFFSDEPNSLGHSYARLLHGPGGRHDLTDVIELLQKEPSTKRALVTFLSVPNGKIPCVTAVQFLVREQALQLIYFARGQDAFGKFYADALCLIRLAEKVAQSLGLGLGSVRGLIGSSHIYHRDMPKIRETLDAAHKSLTARRTEGVLA